MQSLSQLERSERGICPAFVTYVKYIVLGHTAHTAYILGFYAEIQVYFATMDLN